MDSTHNQFTKLREKACKLLNEKGKITEAEFDNDINKLIEELNVHTIELELQHEDLKNTHNRLEKANEKYEYLYDFAPVGLFTFNHLSNILSLNNAAAHLLSVKKNILLGKNFLSFVKKDDKTVFYRHLKQALENDEMQHDKIAIQDHNKQTLFIKLQSIRYFDEDVQAYLIKSSATDVTKSHKQKLQNEEKQKELHLMNEKLKTSEAKFKAAQNFYTRVLSEISDTVILTDKNGYFTYVCPNILTNFGYTVDEVLEQEHINKLFAPAAFDFDEIIRKKEIINKEIRITGKNGKLRDLLINIKTVDIENGKVLFVCRDISDRKKTENELKYSNQQNKMILNSINDGFFALNQKFEVTYFNNSAEKLLHAKREKVIGKKLFNVFAEAKGSVFEKKYRQALKNAEPTSFETYFGVAPYENWYKVNVYPFRTGISVFFQVITEQKRAQQKIKESEEKLRKIFTASPNAISIVDTNGKIIDCNQAKSSLYGYSKDEIINMTIFDFVYDKDSTKRRKLWETLKKQGWYRNEELRLQAKTGRMFYGMQSANTIHDEKDKPQFFVSITQDITDRKNDEEALKMKTEEIAAQNEEYEVINEELRELNQMITEINQQLSVSEERFRTLVENTPNGILVHSNYMIEFINPAGASTLGGNSADDFIGKSIWNFFDKHNEILKKRFAGLYDKKDSTGLFETKAKCLNNSMIDIEISGTYIGFQNKPAAQEVFRNISQRKKAQKDLRLFKAVIQEANEAIAISAANGKMLYINPAHQRLFGYTYDEACSKTLLDYHQPLSLKKMQNEILPKLQKGQSWEGELDVKNKYGKRFPIWERAGAICDKNGNPQYFYAFMHDITERRKAEQKLRESENKFRTIFDNAPLGIFRSTKEGRFLEVNPALAKMLGFTTPQQVITEISDIAQQLYRFPDKRNKILFKSEETNGVTKYENWYKRKDGSAFIANLSLKRVTDHNGNFLYFEGMVEDITEQKEIEKQLIEAKEKAEESDRLKSAFLANMSHEIRTPMNGILGFSQLLEKKSLSTERRAKYIDIIQSSTKHLLAIISDIIDISKIEAGQLSIHRHPFNINKLLQELYYQFDMERKEKGKGEIVISVKSELPDFAADIESDETRIRQIMSNLIGNAIKFTENGFIEYGYKMNTETSQPFIEFYVKDTGIGISEAKQHIIFERFRQEDDTHSRAFGGTGLGLTISKALVELLGGTIWLTSKKNNGTTFYFTIPYKTSDDKLTSVPVHSPDRPVKENWKDKTVLIVDDMMVVRDFITEIIKPTGADCVYAEKGFEAVSLCEKMPEIDIVLMDIQLPDINGLKATKLIKMKRPELTIIAQTAYALAGDKEKALDAGCDDYITKPIDKDLLMLKISQLLFD